MASTTKEVLFRDRNDPIIRRGGVAGRQGGSDAVKLRESCRSGRCPGGRRDLVLPEINHEPVLAQPGLSACAHR